MHYDKNDPHAYSNEMGRYKTRKQLSFIRKFLPRRGIRILDIGGGNGRLAVPLAESGQRVTVVDESALAVDLLSKENHPSITCVHSDILSFRNCDPFEVAIAVDSVKHMTSVPLATLFWKINHLIVPGGVFILIDINTGSLHYRMKQVIKRICPYNIASHEGYLQALHQSSFEWVKSCGSNWIPFTFNSNSPLVKVFALLEPLFMLDRWPSQSPWVMVASRKTPHHSPSPQPIDFEELRVPQNTALPSGFGAGSPASLSVQQGEVV